MILENQVCTIDQARRLVELGVNYKTFFFWQTWKGDKNPSLFWRGIELGMPAIPLEQFPAYTVAELGVMLPDGLHTREDLTINSYLALFMMMNKMKIVHL